MKVSPKTSGGRPKFESLTLYYKVMYAVKTRTKIALQFSDVFLRTLSNLFRFEVIYPKTLFNHFDPRNLVDFWSILKNGLKGRSFEVSCVLSPCPTESKLRPLSPYSQNVRN